MDYKAHIMEDWPSGRTKIELYGIDSEQKGHYFTLTEGKLTIHPLEEDSSPPEPLFTLSGNSTKKILRALTDALSELGFVAEIDNKQRIVAEALAEERKNELEYYKKVNVDIINKLIG